MRWFAVLGMLCLASAASAETPLEPVRAAITRSLPRIEQGAGNYLKNRQCFSCHHQAMAILSLTSARQRGFDVAPEKIRQQIDFTLATFRPKKEQILKGQGIGGASATAAYALFALEAGGHEPDETTASLIEFLLQRQRGDGAWPAVSNRPPTEGSLFTNAALGIRSLKAYGGAGASEELKGRIDTAYSRARDWLLQNKPITTEDRMFHLRGLVYAGAEAKQIETARHTLLKQQGEDGSWSQLPELTGDAYATGAVLMALRTSGVTTNEPAFQRGIKYLLGTQRDDGAWLVETRSKPIQVFFDNGDPGGKSQFISFVATNWATLALLETIPVK